MRVLPRSGPTVPRRFDSALLPAAWRFLGAPRAQQGHLEAQRTASRRTMPRPHRVFLEALSPKTSVRSIVLAAEACAPEKRLPVHALAVLEAAHNACLDELLRVCSRRSQMVCRYLPNYAAAFRRDEFEHDRQALLAGRLGVVLARRVAADRARGGPRGARTESQDSAGGRARADSEVSDGSGYVRSEKAASVESPEHYGRGL